MTPQSHDDSAILLRNASEYQSMARIVVGKKRGGEAR